MKHDTASNEALGPSARTTDDAPREVELKLFVPPSSVGRVWEQPLLNDHATGPLVAARIDSRYFDTPDHALAMNGLALRLRRSGRRWVQTLKSRGDAQGGALSSRGEWEMQVAGPALELARLRDTPLASIASMRTLATRLKPMFATSFRRESRVLRLGEGTEVEVAFDVGTIVAGRGRSRRVASICELEIEVKRAGGGDDAKALLRFAERLARALPLIPLADSKAARGYRLVRGAAVEPATPTLPEAKADEHPARHLGRVLDACNEAMLFNAHALLEAAAGNEPRESSAIERVEFVHQARVAIRRARSALRTFRPVSKGRRFDALDDALREIGHAFGAARDQDVFADDTMKRLTGQAASDADGKAAVAEVGEQMSERRVDAYRSLIDALDRGPFGATAIATMRLVARLGADRPDRRTLAETAPAWLASQRDRIVRPARRIAVLDEEQRHGLRIEVKRLRYALDLLESLYEPDVVARFHDALAELQMKLGALTDEAVARTLIGSLAQSPSRDLVLDRYSQWFDRHVDKQLPKVAALAVAFELAPVPWSRPRDAAIGSADSIPFSHGLRTSPT